MADGRPEMAAADVRRALVLHDRPLVVDLITLTLNHGVFAVRAAEPVKPGETPAVEDQACGTSVSGWLIQTSVGTGLASGGPLTNRSGCAA